MKGLTANQEKIKKTLDRSKRFAGWIKHLGGFRAMELHQYAKCLFHLEVLHSIYKSLESKEDR